MTALLNMSASSHDATPKRCRELTFVTERDSRLFPREQALTKAQAKTPWQNQPPDTSPPWA